MKPTRPWLLPPGVTAAAVVVCSAGIIASAQRATAAEPMSVPASALAAPRPATFARVPARSPAALFLRSEVGLVVDEQEGAVLYARRADEPRPIASLTKLMTAFVIVRAGLALDELIEITRADRDHLRNSPSRLPYGATFTRLEMLQAALAGSDNRAAAALARTYPGGSEVLVTTMNEKAWSLGMVYTRFSDPTGLDSGNVSSASDLARLARAIEAYPLIGALSTAGEFRLRDARTGEVIAFHNTNYLVRSAAWEIALSKTGYLDDAGNCLLMRAKVAERPVTIVLLNSWGRLSKFGDSNRIQRWLVAPGGRRAAHNSAAVPTGR